MRKRPIRRAQLIAPFGPGAMMVTPDGVSLIGAGLDHWFTRPEGYRFHFEPEEFQFHEWRLERELEVDYFRLPPDYREPSGQNRSWDELTNMRLKIPFLRFPQWHVCPKCSRLREWPLVLSETPRCPYCAEESIGRRPPAMVQVRFIAICPDGHVQDFPWREWVHKSATPTCTKPMKLFATGSAGLSATWVKCECGDSRSLENITGADQVDGAGGGEDRSPAARMTYLSRELSADGQPYLCAGRRPWLGEEQGHGCGRPLRGSLRGATNVYYGLARSAIYLPRGDDAVGSNLVDLLEQAPIAGTLGVLADLHYAPTAAYLRTKHEALLAEYTDAQITTALGKLAGGAPEEELAVETDDAETAFRRAEHAALRTERREDQLWITSIPVEQYQAPVRSHFARVTLIEKLRETRALTGFARVFAENEQSLDDRKLMLWRDSPGKPNRWLPAYQVFGEGIYLELEESRLREWESRLAIQARVEKLRGNFAIAQANRGLRERAIPPRFVLVHTLAHLLMNQLIFDCGYSSASLRERLYISTNAGAPMAGMLIYTAAGDVEGTMGGLVRMGKPGNLEPVITRALENAQWCSSDPVCMELGKAGQGPDSCNLAACHNCSLVPETSCEQFNRFLDRWLVIGSPEDPDPGFFSHD